MDAPRRGAALLLAFLVLIVMIAIMYQIQSVTQIDARIARQEIARARMDEAIRSAVLQVYEDLAEDARAALGDEGGEGAAAQGAQGLGGQGGGEGGGEPGDLPRNPETVDSKMDSWYTPQSTNFEEIQIRILVRDEESKYNVLNMLDADEERAEEAFIRVVRILDKAREGTDLDIDSGEAEEMASAMLDYMRDRRSYDDVGKPVLLTDEEESEVSLPLTFREFRVLEPFREIHFRDLFGPDDERIHSIDAFLTIFTSPSVGAEEAASGPSAGVGGDIVNVNTAPLAVLSSMFDSRDIDYRVWDQILDYRNEDEEPIESEDDEGLDDEEEDPLLDEFGGEVEPTQIFDSLDELEEIDAFSELLEEEKQRVLALLGVESQVFEIICAARISTRTDGQDREQFESRREQEEYFRSGTHLVRVVRTVVWRREAGDDVEIVPLIPFEVLPDAPLQILDFPEED